MTVVFAETLRISVQLQGRLKAGNPSSVRCWPDQRTVTGLARLTYHLADKTLMPNLGRSRRMSKPSLLRLIAHVPLQQGTSQATHPMHGDRSEVATVERCFTGLSLQKQLARHPTTSAPTHTKSRFRTPQPHETLSACVSIFSSYGRAAFSASPVSTSEYRGCLRMSA